MVMANAIRYVVYASIAYIAMFFKIRRRSIVKNIKISFTSYSETRRISQSDFDKSWVRT